MRPSDRTLRLSTASTGRPACPPKDRVDKATAARSNASCLPVTTVAATAEQAGGLWLPGLIALALTAPATTSVVAGASRAFLTSRTPFSDATSSHVASLIGSISLGSPVETVTMPCPAGQHAFESGSTSISPRTTPSVVAWFDNSSTDGPISSYSSSAAGTANGTLCTTTWAQPTYLAAAISA